MIPYIIVYTTDETYDIYTVNVPEELTEVFDSAAGAMINYRDSEAEKAANFVLDILDGEHVEQTVDFQLDTLAFTQLDPDVPHNLSGRLIHIHVGL